VRVAQMTAILGHQLGAAAVPPVEPHADVSRPSAHFLPGRGRIAIVGARAALLLAVAGSAGLGLLAHSHRAPAVDNPARSAVLSHRQVEQSIEIFSGAPRPVICNGGTDMPHTFVGQTYICTAGNGTSYTITITDTSTGGYNVR
jgi:hypothetical protein